MLPERYLAALRLICTWLTGADVTWVVTGSTALAAQGLPVAPHDIELQTDEAGAYAVERALAGSMTRLVAFSATESIRSHFGTALMGGVEVEVMGDVEVRRPVLRRRSPG